MNLRRHLLETVTLVVAAIALALVANTLASRERKLQLPGDYPNATVVTKGAPAGDHSAPSQAGSSESSPATAQQASGSLSSKVNEAHSTGPPEPRGTAASPLGSSLSKKTSVGASPAPPSADVAAAFPPHPDRPYVEITGEDAARLFASGALFLDARRTSDYIGGHIAGARPVSVWESDVDEKVMALLGERDGKQPLVLYCSGGDCEDSHMLAQKLWGAGFSNNLVYRDGFPDWVKRRGPVRSGAKP
jgi:rhodanese-related sulfurtransferase